MRQHIAVIVETSNTWNIDTTFQPAADQENRFDTGMASCIQRFVSILLRDMVRPLVLKSKCLYKQYMNGS